MTRYKLLTLLKNLVNNVGIISCFYTHTIEGCPILKYSKQNIIEGIKLNNSKVIRYCYSCFFSHVKKYVLKNKGTVHDAMDIFQEALECIYLKENIDIQKSFLSYFISICKNCWRQKKRKADETCYIEENTIDEDKLVDIEYDFSGINELKYEIFSLHFQRLDAKCQQLLKMFYDKISFEKISDEIGITPDSIIRRKNVCRKKLIDNVRIDVRNKNPETKSYIL